jgi:predicted KAP-like P-loop ATPase
MFLHERPIFSRTEDFLNRKNFSEHLGKSLLSWKEDESLVIGLTGEWGSGKSSIINLAIETLNNSETQDKPTIVIYNPWAVSELHTVNRHFFKEITNALIDENNSDDKKLAKLLTYYAGILELIPDEKAVASFGSQMAILLGLLSVTAGEITNWLQLSLGVTNKILFILGFTSIVIGALKSSIKKYLNILILKTQYHNKSISELKEKIINIIKDRKNKLLVVIDDIDRLNLQEIRQIFRLIRVNADFPNTIYLLAYDSNIIEKSLTENILGINGKEYLKKVVQVSFDVPVVNVTHIHQYLLRELKRILDNLPGESREYFGDNDTYWTNIFHSGYKEFFKNIRDVKRYVSSLEFNLIQLCQNDIFEVNPIDFMAIEAIRVFIPEYYSFVKGRKVLFTSTSSTWQLKTSEEKPDSNSFGLDIVSPAYKNPLRELIGRLFPQIAHFIQPGSYSYDSNHQAIWARKLRVCSTDNFDSYFALIPGGDESEISNFELQSILQSTRDSKKFEDLLRQYLSEGRLSKLLYKLSNYTSEEKFLPTQSAQSAILGMFNISDDLPEEGPSFSTFGVENQSIGFVYQILRRNNDKGKNYEILKNAIIASNCLYGPIGIISWQTSRDNDPKDPDSLFISVEKILELHSLCIDKVIEKKELLLENPHFLYIIYRWKEWDKNECWKDYIRMIIDDDYALLKFVGFFNRKGVSQTIGEYGIRKQHGFDYDGIRDFADLDDVKNRIKEIRIEKGILYQDNRDVIEIFLDESSSIQEDDEV